MTTRPVPAGLASLTDFRPQADAEDPSRTAAPIRAIAEAHGFVERNSPAAPRKRRRPVDEPTYSFTARVTVRAADRFIAWCEEERISYREGFERLVALINQT